MRTPDRFIELINSSHSAESSFEVLGEQERRLEGLQLAMRMREGVPMDSFTTEDLEMMSELLNVAHGVVTLTRAGRLLANEVLIRLK